MTHAPRAGAIALVLLVACLTGCGGPDEAACKKAIYDAAGRAASGSTVGRPAECAGISDADLQRLAKEVIGQKIGESLGTTTEDTTDAAAEQTTTTEAPVVAQLTMGGTATVTDGDGESTGEITISKPVSYRKPTDRQFGEKPKNGRFLRVTIVAVGKSGEFDVNPFDLYLATPAGDRFDTTDGHASYEAGDNELHDAALNPGERIRATLVFDAPTTATSLVYAPAGQTVATWSIG